MQPPFDYACAALYPNFSKKLENRIQTYKIYLFVSVYGWIKCCVCLKMNLKQLVGCSLKKDIISV